MALDSLGIVVPTLNAAGTLAATLNSLEAIEAAGARVVIVDGGSTDKTLDIVALRRLSVISHRGGLYSALNKGFRSLETKWLTWINGDDLLYGDSLLPRITNAGSAFVLYGRVDFIDVAGRFMHSWMSAAPGNLLTLYKAGFSPLLQQGTLFRRSVFDSIGGFDERYRFVADADFWWRALEAGFPFERASHPPVAAFRLHSSQFSQTAAAEMRTEHKQMVRDHGGPHRSLRALAAVLRWRLANAPSYAMRAMRRHQLDGSVGVPSSYSLRKETG